MADRWGDLPYALGGWSGRTNRRSGRQVDGPCEKWKPNLKVIKAMIQFVIKTGRFQPRATEVDEVIIDEVIEDGEEEDEVDTGLEMEEDSGDDDVGGSH
jgi:hypothetical protein